MKKYALKTKDGEAIYKIDASNLFEAVERFSILKKMEVLPHAGLEPATLGLKGRCSTN